MENFIIVLMLLLMFTATVYSVDSVLKIGKQTQVGQAVVTQKLTKVGCLSIAIICTAYNAACVYVILYLVG